MFAAKLHKLFSLSSIRGLHQVNLYFHPDAEMTLCLKLYFAFFPLSSSILNLHNQILHSIDYMFHSTLQFTFTYPKVSMRHYTLHDIKYVIYILHITC